MPKVSVVIPTRNRSDMLTQAINSVLNQTYKDYEILISDNQSIDNTSVLATNLVKENKKIRYYRTTHSLSMVENWNNVLPYIKGKYFTLLMDDDMWEPEFLEQTVKHLDRDNRIGVVAVQPIPYYRKNSIKAYPVDHYRLNNGDMFLKGTDCISLFLQRKWRVGLPSAVLSRAKYLKKLGMFREPGIDPEMWLRILTISDFYYVDQKLTKWRIVQEGSYTSINNNRLKSNFTLMKVMTIVFNNLGHNKNQELLNHLKASINAIKKESLRVYRSLGIKDKIMLISTLWSIQCYE